MKIDIPLPELGESIEKGDIVKWLVKVGDLIAMDQPVMEIETGKAVVEVPSTGAGRVAKLHFEEGDSAKVGDVILSLEGEGTIPAAAGAQGNATTTKPEAKSVTAVEKATKKSSPSTSPKPNGETSLPASPGVKRIAREAGIELSQVSGTGIGGRITVSDLAARIGVSGIAPTPQMKLPDFSVWGETEVKPMSNVRKATAEHLSRSWVATPQVTQFDKADITQLDLLRKKYAAKAEAAGGKLTMTVIAVKLCAAALKKFPQFNASIDMSSATVVFKRYVHIGVAVDTDRGLLVPVLRDCDRKGMLELSTELAQLSEKARKAQLSLEQMQGGCFSISNLGGIGGTGFSPIVNGPEVAILGMSRAATEPVWTGTQFEPRLIMPLALSYDHRLIDGADAARFLRFICEAMEEPLTLFL